MIKSTLNQRLFRSGVFSLLLLSIAACGSAPPRLPAAIEQARKADQAAHRALRDGDPMRARELFKQSMLLQQSLENIPAAAAAAINLSSVTHKLGDDSAALDLLNNVLSGTAASIPSELRAAAAFRKGIILADIGKTGEAESAVQLAKQECKQQCEFEPGINTLQARLNFGKGDYAAALAVANKVMNTGAGKEEQANAQRIAAAAETALGQHEAALKHYQGALEMDKELALSARIVEDLKGMSRVLESLGRKQEAEIFAHRAELVSAAAQTLSGNNQNKAMP
jgi:tetratricopeptide (TPR) repeat protein